MSLTDVERRVFEFVDENECAESGVSVARLQLELDLPGINDFERDVLIEDAAFGLVDKGFLSMVSEAVFRVDSYPE